LAANAIAQSNSDSALGRVLPDDVLIELRDDFARSHIVERGKKFLLFRGRGAIATGREYYFFIGLAGHEMSNPFVRNPQVSKSFDARK
jgi:hypothetical protein